jgi:hypothetical protein
VKDRHPIRQAVTTQRAARCYAYFLTHLKTRDNERIPHAGFAEMKDSIPVIILETPIASYLSHSP